MYMYTRVYTGYPGIVAASFIREFFDRFRIDSDTLRIISEPRKFYFLSFIQFREIKL